MQDHESLSLETVLREGKLTPLFQPIVASHSQTIFGYEALIRGPSNSPLHSPLTLFDTASRTGHLVELDLLCRRLSIERFAAAKLPGHLFLNVMPNSLVEQDFRQGLTVSFLRSVGLDPSKVVIELTEHTPIHDYELMRQAVSHYRSMGFKVALDDLGAGYSSLRHWSELRPDFVKIDRHFVQDIDRDPLKRQFLQSLMEVSHNLHCQVIAEGIETQGEYHTLWGLDWPLLQGYYFARPSERPPKTIHHLLPPNSRASGPYGATAATLCQPVEPLAPNTPVLEVAQRFKQQSQVRCLAVVDQDKPVGVVRRHDFLNLFASPYGHALYARRFIKDLIDTAMIVTAESTPLESLSQTITTSDDFAQQDFVIVDDQQRYCGMGNIVDLLREITAIQVRSARHANPLTGLPGNMMINDMLNRRLASGEAFAAIYCDLDNFKAYNDAYGYARGDEVIVSVARLLQTCTLQEGDFLGHVGGDDFVLILDLTAAEATCSSVLQEFEQLAPTFYSAEHRQAGGLLLEDRSGKETFFPIMSLSLALEHVAQECHENAIDVGNRLAELKQQAKRQPGNSLFVNRRQPANAKGFTGSTDQTRHAAGVA